MKPYHGHRSYGAYCVWRQIETVEENYRLAARCVRESERSHPRFGPWTDYRRAAREFIRALADRGEYTTPAPERVPYGLCNVRHALKHLFEEVK